MALDQSNCAAVLEELGVDAYVGDSICGPHGKCVVEQEENKVDCLCTSSAFAVSPEFVFFSRIGGNADFSEELQLVPCNVHKQAHVVANSVAVVVTSVTILAYISALRKLSQAKRLVPYFCCLLIFLTISIIRLVNFTKEPEEQRLIGEDVFITVSFAIIVLLINLTLHMYLNKYISYQYKTLRIKSRKAKVIIKRAVKVLKVNSLSSIVAFLFFCLTLVGDRFSLLKEVFFRLGFLIAAGNAIVILYYNRLLLHKLRADIRSLNNASDLTNQTMHTSQMSMSLMKKKRTDKVLFNVLGVECSGFSFHSVNVIYFLLGAFSVETLGLWRFFVPLMIAGSCASTLVVLFFNKRSKRIRLKQIEEPAMIAVYQSKKMSSNNWNRQHASFTERSDSFKSVVFKKSSLGYSNSLGQSSKMEQLPPSQEDSL